MDRHTFTVPADAPSGTSIRSKQGSIRQSAGASACVQLMLPGNRLGDSLIVGAVIVP